MKRINVTKTFMPPLDEYVSYLESIWASGQITNQGPLLRQFENETIKYLGVDNFHFVANGTLALQLALRGLNITDGEIITTPFSYVATTSSILWERCTPVFVDINPKTLNIDPSKIEATITENTKAIMAVHVFGNPCDVDAIQEIADKHNLKVIYDAAHAFGVEYKGKSLLSYGDISTCSFHATKLFHTVEGGGVFTSDKQVSNKIELLKRFGHDGDDHHMLGINAKATELQAAMGLVNLKYITDILAERKKISELYDKYLSASIMRPQRSEQTTYNYAYFPIILESEEKLRSVLEGLAIKNIYPRRYFYPSLNKLPYLDKGQHCPNSEDIANRIICLPLFLGLSEDDIKTICEGVNT